jgi:cell filamentation protein
MSDDPYVYPGTTILRNKPAIRDAERLDAFERRMATQRAAEGIPTGDFIRFARATAELSCFI